MQERPLALVSGWGADATTTKSNLPHHETQSAAVSGTLSLWRDA